MTLRINDEIPNLEVETDQGSIRLHDWVGDGWAVIFSHPKDLTPVCLTEFGALEQLDIEWKKRGVKVLGVSVDIRKLPRPWSSEIQVERHPKPTFPIAADHDLRISRALDMLSDGGCLPEGPARTVDIIGPDKKVRLSLSCSMAVGRNFSEIVRAIDALRASEGTGVAASVEWQPGDDIII